MRCDCCRCLYFCVRGTRTPPNHVQPGNFEISCEVCKKSTPLGFLRGTRPGNWYSFSRISSRPETGTNSTLIRRFGGVVDFMVVRFAVVFFALIGKLRTLNIHLS